MTRVPGRVPTAAADARRRRRAGRGLAADGLQRRQQPRPAARRHPGARPGGDRRARLLAQPRRPQPAHPRLPPDRPADQPRPGGHRQRADGPVRALAGRDLAARPATTCCSSRAMPEDPLGRVRRPAALHRRRRVRRHRHLPRQPAGRLAGDPPGAVRRLRPPVGRPRRRAPVGRRRRRRRHRAGHQPPARPGPRADRLDRLAQGLLDRRGPPRRLEPRPARPRPAPPPASPRASRTPSPAAARRPRCSSTRPSRRRSSAPPTPWPWGCCTPWPTAGSSPASDIAVVGFDDSQVAQVVPPGLTSVRQPLEEVAVEIVKALEGLLGHPPVVGPGVLLAPELILRGYRLSGQNAFDQRLTA